MGDNRLQLQTLLEEVTGNHQVHFQPPSSVRMKYPAIKYSRKRIDSSHANNVVYKQKDVYELIVIDEDPDSEIVRTISKLPQCRLDRHYESDNLNHDVFTLYY